MRKLLAGLGMAAAVIACSSGHEDLGQSSAGVDYICSESAATTLDGIPAYAYCGNFNVWSNNGADTKSSSGGAGWVQTEGGYGYQCVEYAVRYAHFKFGVSTSWAVSYAKEMCVTHPTGISTTTTPIHGDLVVFTPGVCGVDATAGHVAVLDSQTTSNVTVAQENTAGKYTYNKTCVSCYLHEASNNGTSDPCSGAPVDGDYCGQSTQFGPGGTKDDLYHCAGGATSSKTTCPYGCLVEPPNTNDKCAAAPPSDAGSDASTTDAAPPKTDAGGAQDAAPHPSPEGDAGTTTTTSSGCSSGGLNGDPTREGVAFIALAIATLTRRRSAKKGP